MTNSKSINSINNWRVHAMRVVAAVAILVVWAMPAHAGGRKRIVVIEFEGPKADKFHDDIVRLIKKTNTVVPFEKWSGAAEELDASKITDKNVKKIARKLKVDGIVTGKIEKRRDEYIIQIKLRAGTTGEIVGNRVDTKADGPRIEGQAGKDIKQELIPAIEGLEANHGGGGDDEDDSKPAKKKGEGDASDDDEGDGSKHGGFSKSSDDARGGDKVGKKSKGEDDDADAKPVKKSKKELEAEAKAAKKAKKDEAAEAKAAAIKAKKDEEAEAKAAKKAKKDEEAEAKVAKKTKKDEDDAPVASSKHDDDESPIPETKKRSKSSGDEEGDEKPNKKVAKKDDDDEAASVDADAEPKGSTASQLSVSERAVDVVIGMSFMARSLKFKYDTDLATPPPGYSQSVPVAGFYLDATAYPLSFGHKRHDVLAGLGLSVLYDRVLVINSQKTYTQMGVTSVAKIPTTEARFGVGAVFRYPLGKGVTAPVIGVRLGYIGQSFAIGQLLPNGAPVDIPNVSYSIVELGGFVRYPVTEKIVLNADASILPVLGSGDMTSAVQYGKGSVLGFQFAVGGDYLLTKSLFLRASVRLERIGFSFDGTGKQATMRDADTMQDVQGATDMYYGGTATVGYLY